MGYSVQGTEQKINSSRYIDRQVISKERQIYRQSLKKKNN